METDKEKIERLEGEVRRYKDCFNLIMMFIEHPFVRRKIKELGLIKTLYGHKK